MPLRTEEIDLADEQERLREEMEGVAEEQVEWQQAAMDADTDQSRQTAQGRAQELTVRGNELNNQANILSHLEDEWGVDSVTLAGLTAGEVNRVEDTVEDNPGVRERDAWVAIGTNDAPYLAHDPENVTQDDYEQTVSNVTDLPLAYVRWAEEKISELSHLSESEGNGYSSLVREKLDAATPVTDG